MSIASHIIGVLVVWLHFLLSVMLIVNNILKADHYVHPEYVPSFRNFSSLIYRDGISCSSKWVFVRMIVNVLI